MNQPLPTSSAVVVSDFSEAVRELASIGLTHGDVDDIARIAESGKASGSTDLDPKNAPGLLSYIYGVRGIRLTLLPKGWRKSFVGGIEATVNDELGVQLVFQNVEEACSRNDPEPKSKKGSSARKLVNEGQGDMFAAAYAQANINEVSKRGVPPAVWLVCFSSFNGLVKAEVSCPRRFDGERYEGFSKRILVVNDNGGFVATKTPAGKDEDSFDVDVIVSKKTGNV